MKIFLSSSTRIHVFWRLKIFLHDNEGVKMEKELIFFFTQKRKFC